MGQRPRAVAFVVSGAALVDRSFWAGRRVLVTGHTGFKGGWLSLWLQSLGSQVGGLSSGAPTDPSLYAVARVGAGMSVPRHTHRGAEMVCVLKGAFTDRGETYGPGDFVESDEDVDHRPQATGEGECVCLVAVDASLVARDWVGRLFQPLVRI